MGGLPSRFVGNSATGPASVILIALGEETDWYERGKRDVRLREERQVRDPEDRRGKRCQQEDDPALLREQRRGVPEPRTRSQESVHSKASV